MRTSTQTSAKDILRPALTFITSQVLGMFVHACVYVGSGEGGGGGGGGEAYVDAPMPRASLP